MLSLFILCCCDYFDRRKHTDAKFPDLLSDLAAAPLGSAGQRRKIDHKSVGDFDLIEPIEIETGKGLNSPGVSRRGVVDVAASAQPTTARPRPTTPFTPHAQATQPPLEQGRKRVWLAKEEIRKRVGGTRWHKAILEPHHHRVGKRDLGNGLIRNGVGTWPTVFVT